MRLFSTDSIEFAKQKITTSPWAKAGWDAMQARVANWHSQSVEIPAEAGGWIHNYVCSEHWLPLSYDGDSPTAHVCPAGHICTGEKLDAAWRVWRHRQLTDLAREAGLTFVVLGDEAGRETAVSILTQYADFYTRFDGLSDAEPWMLKGHAFNQALTEALWAVPLIHAYDLIADSLDEAEKARFEQDLWSPLTAVMTTAQDKLLAKDFIESNYMAWFNVTLGCLGFALADQVLIDRAIQPPAGFVAHLDKAIFADGMEFEGTPYYHNFVLLADLILAEAAHANGIDLYAVSGSDGQSLASMGRALAQLAWPDGSLPDLGEGSYWQDSIYTIELIQAFELLSSRQPNALFEATLHNTYILAGKARNNWAALLYGRDFEKTAVSHPTEPTLLKQSGIARLQTNSDLAAMVHFGPFRGHHHQFDRLSVAVWPFSRDAGSPLYALPERKTWYLHSYAHNTLVVDGQSHAECGGELLAWNGRLLKVSAPQAYPDVTFERTIEVLEKNLLDELLVESDTPHTFDWVFHIDGNLKTMHKWHTHSAPLATNGPAAYIELHACKEVRNDISFTIQHNSASYQLKVEGKRPFTLYLGTAPGTTQQPQQRRHVLIGRTVGTAQRYRTTISQI